MTEPAAGTSPWLVFHNRNPRARMRLFCFPHAGGSALVYRHWSERVPVGVEVCPVQHPGQGKRMLERPFTRLTPMVEAMAPALRPFLDMPFAFFGHSMGALIAFELARQVRMAYGLLPVHLFVSGRGAPQVPRTCPPAYNLPDDEFIAELQRINGAAKDLLENEELVQLVLPSVRADFEIVDTYAYAPEPPLSCPITALGGAEDCETAPESLDPWSEQTTGAFSSHILPGDHFYLQNTPAPFFQALNYKLHRALTALEREP